MKIRLLTSDDLKRTQRGVVFSEEELVAIDKAMQHFRELGYNVEGITFQFTSIRKSYAYWRERRIELTKTFLSRLNGTGKVEHIKHEIGHILFRENGHEHSPSHGAEWKTFCRKTEIKMHWSTVPLYKHQEWKK